MQTVVSPVDVTDPNPDRIAQAAAVLRGGGLVAFPTETVYGLGANALDETAVRRIFAAKGRPANNPIIVHVTNVGEARRLVAVWPDTATRLAARFWPGPLTLVLPRAEVVPDAVTAGGSTVALRAPAHPVAQALLQAAKIPIAAPSANASSRLSPTRAEHVLYDLDGRIDLLLDGGPCAGGIESTVLDLSVTPPRLLRPGLVLPHAIETVLGRIRTPLTAAEDPAAPLPSPGMLARHYAPRAVLECVASDAARRMDELAAAGVTLGWLTFGPGREAWPDVTVVPMPDDAAAYAARLYAVLHNLDAAGVEHIVVELPPDEEAWLAVRDRLRRAASGRS